MGRRGFGNINAGADDIERALNVISTQLSQLDALLAIVPLFKSVEGTVGAAGTVTIRHGLGIKPDEIFLIPDTAVTFSVTTSNRRFWSDKVVVVTASGACNFSGYVISMKKGI